LSQGEARTGEKCCEQRKQQKKQIDEAEKDQRRREKEEAELKKKREKEEAELKKKREKEEAELKKKRSIQKQASIMERFLKRSKPNPSVQNDKVSTKPTASDLLCTKNEIVSKSATLSMDNVLASCSDIVPEDLRK
jgi:chromatin assembly factor 1 subunit A